MHPFTLTSFSAIAERLPAHHREALGAENPDPTAHVLWHEGDLALEQLDLEALSAPPEDEGKPAVWLVVVQGTLRVHQAVLGAPQPGDGAHLAVLGDLHARQVLLCDEILCVQGDLQVQELLWGEQAPGRLQVQGQVRSTAALFSQGFGAPGSQGHACDLWIDTAPPSSDPTGYRHEALAARILPEGVDGLANTHIAPHTLLQRDALLTLARQGLSLLRPAEDCPVVPPPVQDFCVGDAISIAHIRALVQPPLVPRGEKRAQAWFGQTDYDLCQRHVDKDGTALDEAVHATVHRQWDFFFSIQRRLPGLQQLGLWGWLATRAGLRPAMMQDQLHLAFRRIDHGTPGDWQALDEASPPEVREAAQTTWRNVLTHARENLAQARASHPQWRAAQQLATEQSVEALTQLPLFTEKYNDWWDSDRNGYWEESLWVGARQPGRNDESRWGRAFKLAWLNPSESNPEDNDHSCYQIDLDPAPGDKIMVDITHSQRQDDERTTIARHDAAHLLRFQRLFAAMQQCLLQQHDQLLRAQAQAARIEATVRLLVRPPVSAARPDAEIFPPELLAMSDPWQHLGRDYVEHVRAIRRGDRTGDIPDDPRTPHHPMVMQLARVVHRSHDAGLSERFRQRFAFAPDAAAPIARDTGECVSAAFWLDDARTLARVGEPWQDNARWLLLHGLEATPLPQLQGAGRSPNRQCWAWCERGELTTRQGIDGPTIAIFTLPQGHEGLPTSWALKGNPLAQRCDQLIPFNDGQRMLLRNPTGIYLLSASGAQHVQRLHPQDFDDQDEHTLNLAMLHMALSPDERWVALGDQDSAHLLLRIPDGHVQRRLEPLSSYPHHALFTADSTALVANACHLYQGTTGLWPLTASEPGDEPQAQRGPWRVYASAHLPGAMVLGEAHGYVHAVDATLQPLWRHHVGSTISALDTSPDGHTILVGSYGGYLACLQHRGTPDPYSIGTSPYHEAWRWIFWTGEAAPTRW